MTKIDHSALYVQRLEDARVFFEKYFGGKSNALYHNEKTGFSSYFLTFGSDYRLEIMSRPALSGSANPTEARIGHDHISFSVGGVAAMDKLTAVLEKDGFQVLDGPRIMGDGYYESCIVGPENIKIEITE